jgi:hypothetical protein
MRRDPTQTTGCQHFNNLRDVIRSVCKRRSFDVVTTPEYDDQVKSSRPKQTGTENGKQDQHRVTAIFAGSLNWMYTLKQRKIPRNLMFEGETDELEKT